MSARPGGIQVTGFLDTTALSDTYATHLDILGQGGAMSVLTVSDMNAIPVERRKFGMIVTVYNDVTGSNNKTYRLNNVNLGGVNDTITDNSNWQQINASTLLTNGNGTVVSGSSVNLGGNISTNTFIEGTTSITESVLWGITTPFLLYGIRGKTVTLYSSDDADRFISVDPTNTKVGFNASTLIDITDKQISLSGTLKLQAGTTTVAPIKLQSGVALTTPVNGSLEYHASHLYFTIGSTRYQLDQQGGGGITNGAAVNELTKSDGTNIISSGLFSLTNGNLQLGSASISGGRTIFVNSSDTNADLNINSQGTGQIVFNSGNAAVGSNGRITSLTGFESYNPTGNSSISLSAISTSGKLSALKTAVDATFVDLTISSFTGIVGDVNGGHLVLNGGTATTNGNGGNITLNAGAGNGSGVNGSIKLSTLNSIILGDAALTGTSRTITTDGSNSTVNLNITPKGGGSVTINSNVVSLIHSSAASYFTFDGGSSLIRIASLSTGSGTLISGGGDVSVPNSGDLFIKSNNAYGTGNNNSGNIYLSPGTKNGTGTVGNIGLLTTSGSFGSGEKVIFIGNAITPASTVPVDGVILHAEDSVDTTSSLALYLEQAVEAVGTFTPSHKIKIKINGTWYWWQLDQV